MFSVVFVIVFHKSFLGLMVKAIQLNRMTPRQVFKIYHTVKHVLHVLVNVTAIFDFLFRMFASEATCPIGLKPYRMCI